MARQKLITTSLCLALLALCSLIFVAGCGKGACNPLTSKKALVKLQAKADIVVPSPVTLNGVTIGQVTDAALDSQNKPLLSLCLEKKFLEGLRKTTVFYVNKEGAGTTLVCEVIPDDATPIGDDPVFLGFDSYSNYLAWRTENIVKKGVNDLLKVIDGALK